MGAQEETLRAKLMAKTAEARAVLERNLTQGATVMVRKTLATWKSWVADEVKDRELATANAAALKAFQETNRAQAMQVITRMNCSNENILIEACFENWAWIFKEVKEEKEDLEEELQECRRKNWEIQEHFQEMYELHHSLNQHCDDMMLED